MHAIRISAALVCAVSALVLAATGAAGVSSPRDRTGSGTFTVESVTVTGEQQQGRDTIVDLTQVGVDTGSRPGTGVNDYEVTIHPTGRLRLRGSGTFTGTLDGCGPIVNAPVWSEAKGYTDATGQSILDGHTRNVGKATPTTPAFRMTWHTDGNAGTYEISYRC